MTEPLKLLVIDDDAAIRRIFRDLVGTRPGLSVDDAADGTAGVEKAMAGDYDVILTDLQMPGLDGMELLERVKAVRPGLPVVIFTAHGSIEKAVEAMRKGADDFLPKPFQMGHLLAILERLRRVRGITDENRDLRRRLEARDRIENLIGLTEEMEKVREVVRRVQREVCNVVVLGESGTGKDIVARAIHAGGPRATGPFVPVNCAAIAPSLLESELFGHEKGAFTGAHAMRRGLFEDSRGGTLFLDEVAEIPLDLQAALLRVLEERKVRRVGGSELIDVDARLIAATNDDLPASVEAGRFRRDLFYRLNVVMIPIPPLRKRKDDIPLLVNHFFRRREGAPGARRMTGVAPEAMNQLLRYDWPGNVRELEHVIERAFALGTGDRIGVEDLPPSLLEASRRKSSFPLPAGPAGIEVRSLEETEIDQIRRAMEQAGGNATRAAERLKIDRTTLYRKMKRYGIAQAKKA